MSPNVNTISQQEMVEQSVRSYLDNMNMTSVKNNKKEVNIFNVYILRLQCGKYYVGRTTRPVKQRFEEHLNGNGSAWTKQYKPIEILETKQGDKFLELTETLRMMEKYGIENVRGTTYCQINLSKKTIEEINMQIKGANDRCYTCGSSGHFAAKCPSTNNNTNNTNNTNINKMRCTRCGRCTHMVTSCYANTDISGNPLC